VHWVSSTKSKPIHFQCNTKFSFLINNTFVNPGVSQVWGYHFASLF